jgi:hypothetical protein
MHSDFAAPLIKYASSPGLITSKNNGEIEKRFTKATPIVIPVVPKGVMPMLYVCLCLLNVLPDG